MRRAAAQRAVQVRVSFEVRETLRYAQSNINFEIEEAALVERLLLF